MAIEMAPPSKATLPVVPLFDRAAALVEQVPMSLLTLGARIFPAAIFWQSGQTKVNGWQLSDSAVFLFQEEYRLPLVDPAVAAHVAAFAEHFFPLLLVLGFASRFSALALLGMTAVIQTFVYPSAWPTHGVWAVCFLLVIIHGPGVVSLDYFVRRYFHGGEGRH